MPTDTLKTSICDALAAFIRQRPGFDPRNYGDAASYRADSRTATLQKRDAETLLQAVRWRESISGADILEAARGGRLTITADEYANQPDTPARVRIDYCTGQYFPTEFRAGVCRVLSSALWNWQREHASPAGTDRARVVIKADKYTGGDAYPHDEWKLDDKWMSPGDWLRAKFRREFGSSLARRWFN